MRAIRRSIALASASANCICLSQTPGAAGNLTLNGANVSGGVGTMDAGGYARPVLFTFAGNETGKTYTVYGTILEGGNTVSEAVAGVNASTAKTVTHFLTVTRIANSAANAGAMTVGTDGYGSTKWIPLDRVPVPTNVGFAVEVARSSPATWTFQYTWDDVQDPNLDPATTTTFADSTFTSKSTSLNGNIIAPCTAVRLQIESGTSTTVLNVLQSGN